MKMKFYGANTAPPSSPEVRKVEEIDKTSVKAIFMS